LNSDPLFRNKMFCPMSAETCRGGGDFLYCRSRVLLEGLCFRQRAFLPPAGQPWKQRTWRAARRAGTRSPGRPVLKTAVPATRRQQPRTRLILVFYDPSLAVIFSYFFFRIHNADFRAKNKQKRKKNYKKITKSH
jgi:hypothetical protein